MDMFDDGLSHHFKVPWALANGLTGKKICIREVSLYFQLELNILVFLSAPTDKNVRV
jgi:hypothetical protein